MLVTLFEGNTKILPLEWNCLIIDRNDIKMLRNSRLPELAEEVLKSYENPKIVHFLGMQVLDLNYNILYREEYFSYSEETPYAGLINARIYPKIPKIKLTLGRKIKLKIYKFVDIFFPRGTLRRERLKSIFHKLRRK